VYHGFAELFEMGLIDHIPALAVIQADGCAPMVSAFQAGQEVAAPVTPRTRIAILSTGDPGRTYTYLWRLTQRHGGTMVSVSDAEAFTTMRSLARSEGLAVEPATSVAFAGLLKMGEQNCFSPGQQIVVNCTGHTFPVEKHVLGKGWSVDLALHSGRSAKSPGASVPAPLEGLSTALECLDEKTTTVLIVDDNPDDALLVRRFLEARKNYRVFHATDGESGLAQARERLPDLVILDLMMPNVDGFGVLDRLKDDPRTRDIPVIVVSAKDLTEIDRLRLSGNIEAIYQKGSLPPRTFVDQVVRVIGRGESTKQKKDGSDGQ
jgi:threonine synthase